MKDSFEMCHQLWENYILLYLEMTRSNKTVRFQVGTNSFYFTPSCSPLP